MNHLITRLENHILQGAMKDAVLTPSLKLTNFVPTVCKSNSCFLPFVCLQLEVMLEDNLTLPSNGKLYSKVLNWVQRSLWENGDQLERLMEEVSTGLCSLLSQGDLQFLPCPFPSLSRLLFLTLRSHQGDEKEMACHCHAAMSGLLFFSLWFVEVFAVRNSVPLNHTTN